ncbi:hypothetical protein [uncultured Microbacterium sp.]|uniref:hypothetical protein n=1 Tax=uncultured Microbacterium sp. TaxID=191216 RepID=UPI0025D104A1|nr:hypothetical protein [uncultured Microbacterium sp.]
MSRLLRASLPWPCAEVDVPAALLAAKRLFDPTAIDSHGTRLVDWGDDGQSSWLDIAVTDPRETI